MEEIFFEVFSEALICRLTWMGFGNACISFHSLGILVVSCVGKCIHLYGVNQAKL